MENYLDLLISPLRGHFKVSVHDEVYAMVHVGLVGINLEFFLARICYKGQTSYSVNIFQEGADIKKILNMALRFDKVVKNIVGGIKKGINLFMDVISGRLSIKTIVQNLVKALKGLPAKVADLRSRASNAIKTIGQFDEIQLPPFIKPVKNLINKVQTLFNDIKTDVMNFYNTLEEIIEVKLPVLADRLYKSVIDVIEGFGIIGKNPKSALIKIGVGVFQIYISYKEALQLKNKTQEACFFLKDEKPYWWDIKKEYLKLENLVVIVKDQLKNSGNQWVDDVKEDVVAEFTKGKYTMSKVRKEIVEELTSLIDDLLNPFSYLDGLADPFIHAYEATFGVIKSIKEAHTILKDGYERGKSLLDSIFGSKVPPEFPRKTRLDKDGCRGTGFYPARLLSGAQEYWSEGVDLEIAAGNRIVAPFAGYMMLTDRPNEILIKTTGGSLKDMEVYITNISPKSTILHPNDDNYIENSISSGVDIGTATNSPCTNHIHLTMKKGGGFIDPTRFLEDRMFVFEPYYESCNDYKLVWKGEVKAVGFVVKNEGKDQEDTTPDMPNSDVDPVDPPPMSADPGGDIEAAKSNPSGMFSKFQTSGSLSGAKDMFSTLLKKADSFMKRFSLKKLKLGDIIEFLDKLGMSDSKQKLAEVLKSIKKLIDNKPCLNPAQATDEQLKQELLERGKSSEGSREQMITRLTTPDKRCPWMYITTPDNMYCTYDSMCLGLECCMNVKFLMFLYTIKAYARYDPCQYQFSFGIGDHNYTLKFDMGYDGLSDEIHTGLKFDIMGGMDGILKYDIQKTDTGLLASVVLGLCQREDTSNCLAEFSLLANAVLPLPICKSDGSIVWPQDCKIVVPVDVVFVVDESGSVGETNFKSTMTALSNTVDKLAIGEDLVRIGVTLFAGTGTSRSLLNLNSQYSNTAIKETFSSAVYKKGSYTDIADAFRYACEEMFVGNKGDRSDAQNYLVLLTDGKNNKGASPVVTKAAVCKNANIRIVTVGIGSGIDEQLLKDISYSLPNYYLHTIYDDLHKTLPQLVIQTLDCSFAWNIDYKAYLSLDSIKSTIKEAAIKKLEEGKQLLKGKLLEALGLPEDILQSTGPCLRPDKMSIFQLINTLNNRGLNTTGSNQELTERLKADDRRCETMGREISLPDITNSWLNDHLYYYISNDCLRLDACADISLSIGDFNYAKAFRAFVELDFCKYILKFGFEGRIRSLILISYKWGKTETLTITKDVQVIFVIDKNDDKKVFEIDFGLKLCFQGSCIIDQMFLENHEIPIPICNENFTFSGDSISDLITAIGGKMTEEAFDIVLRHLGLDKHFTSGSCAVPNGPIDCPVMINPQKYLPASIRTMIQCKMTDNCLGLHCCLDLTFKLPLGDKMVTFNIPFWVKFDPCQFEVDIAFGGFRYKRYILNYDWGEKNVISIGKGASAPVQIEYSVDKMADGKGFIVDVLIKICLPIDSDEHCIPQNGIHLLQQQEVPLCSDDFLDWMKDCKSVLPSDVIFVVDESGSVGQDHFDDTMVALSKTIDKLAIRKDMIRVAMSLFGGTDTSRTRFDLNFSYNKTEISTEIMKTSYIKRGYTNIGDALRYACEEMFVAGKGDRNDARDYVVLLTDGKSNRGATAAGAATCSDRNISIIAVGIGDGISEKELRDIVSKQKYYFNTTYTKLSEALPDLVSTSIDCSADLTSFISGWLKDTGLSVLEEIKEGGKLLILKRLGLEEFFNGPKCDHLRKPYSPNILGWNNECPKGSLGMPALPDQMSCHYTSTCTGIECCVTIPDLDLTLHPFIFIDPCEYTINYGINTINKTIKLINYEWGKTEKISLANGIIQLELTIKKPAEMKKFIVDMTAKACFKSTCIPNVKIFDGTEIPQPVCDMNANFNLKNFSLTDWADRVGTDIGQQLDSQFKQLLIEQLGLDILLKKPSCNRNSTSYSPATNGWKNDCPIMTPSPITVPASCYIPDYYCPIMTPSPITVPASCYIPDYYCPIMTPSPITVPASCYIPDYYCPVTTPSPITVPASCYIPDYYCPVMTPSPITVPASCYIPDYYCPIMTPSPITVPASCYIPDYYCPIMTPSPITVPASCYIPDYYCPIMTPSPITVPASCYIPDYYCPIMTPSPITVPASCYIPDYYCPVMTPSPITVPASCYIPDYYCPIMTPSPITVPASCYIPDYYCPIMTPSPITVPASCYIPDYYCPITTPSPITVPASCYIPDYYCPIMTPSPITVPASCYIPDYYCPIMTPSPITEPASCYIPDYYCPITTPSPITVPASCYIPDYYCPIMTPSPITVPASCYIPDYYCPVTTPSPITVPASCYIPDYYCPIMTPSPITVPASCYIPDYYCPIMTPSPITVPASCYIPDYCTGVDCCFDFDYLDLHLNFYLYIDTCKYVIRAGIESLTFEISLFDYNWGEVKEERLVEVIRIRYKIDRLEEQKKLIVDVEFKICLEGSVCGTSFKLFDKQLISQPLCDMEMKGQLLDLSLDAWLTANGEEIGNTLSTAVANKLLDDLGLTNFMSSEPCDRYSGVFTEKGWNTKDCPVELDLPPIDSSVSCYIPDYCTGINCCIEIDQIGKTFNAYALLDGCNWRLTVGIERRKIEISLRDYTWGETKILTLMEVVQIEYSIHDLKGEKKFMLNLKINVCLQKQAQCIFTKTVFQNTKLPKIGCDWSENAFNFDDFSLKQFLVDNNAVGIAKGLVLYKLLDVLGISLDLKDVPCDRRAAPYNPVLSTGWNNGCKNGLPFSLPSLPSSVSCHMYDTCTGMDCCVDVKEISRSLNLFLNLDTCNYYLSGGIEKLTFNKSLINYKFGQKEMFTLKNIIRIEFVIQDLSMEKQFLINMDLSVCFETKGPCVLTSNILRNARLPKPVCDLSSTLSFGDISLKELAENLKLDISEQLPSFAKDLLLEKLGISEYIQNPSCNRSSSLYTPSHSGWKTACPGNIPLPDLGDNMNCYLTDYCTGIDCCVEIPQIRQSFHVYVLLDACNHRMDIGIENLAIHQAYFDFEFDKEQTVQLSKLITLKYSISDLEKRYVVNMSITVCLEPSGPCIMSLEILRNSYLPKLGCNWNFDFSAFSPSKLLQDSGITIDDTLPDVLLSQVMEKMGITDYLQDPQCDRQTYNTDSSGWKNQCDNPNMTLPDLPPDFNCVMYPNCSSVQCCVYVKFLKRNVHLSMDLDICSRKISYAVEKLKNELVFDSRLDVHGQLKLLSFITLDYTLDNTEDEVRVNLNLTVKLDGDTILYHSPLLQDTMILKIPCDWNTGFYIPDFSMQSFLQKVSLPTKEDITKLMGENLLEEMGIGHLLEENSCERSSSIYSPSVNGWKNDCPLGVPLKPLNIPATCRIPNHCTAIDCCIEVDFLHRSFHAYIDINTCDNMFTVGIEKLKIDPVSLINYEFGTTKNFNLKGLVRIGYNIEDLQSQRKYKVNVNLSVCIESFGPCLYDAVVFKDAVIPKIMCDWEADFSLPDFSLEKYTTIAGELVSNLTDSFKEKLYEDLGIAGYLREEPCSLTSATFTPNLNGWKSECNQDLSLPALPSSTVCNLHDTCTNISCCVSVDFLKRSFFANIEMDACQQKIRFSIEKLKQEINILDYKWGTLEKKYLMNVVRLEYVIDDLSVTSEYQISLNISICFESKKTCYLSMKVFDHYKLPKVFCNWGTGFKIPEFSLTKFLEEQKEELSEQLSASVTQTLFNKLGLSEFFLDNQCDRTRDPFLTGWRNDCPSSDLSLTLPSSVSCVVPTDCSALTCCTDIKLISRSISTHIAIDPCNYTMSISIEKLQVHVSLLKYTWGKEKQFTLQGGIVFKYNIYNLGSEKMFMVDLSLHICLEQSDPNSCVFNVTILKNAKLPKPLCNLDMGFKQDDFSFTSWLTENSIVNTGTLKDIFVIQLLRELGVDQYMMSPPCDAQATPYSPTNNQGWNLNKCMSSKPVMLGKLPSDTSCYLSDTCTGVHCCIQINQLGRAITVYLDLDSCHNTFTIGIEKFIHKISILEIEYGAIHSFSMFGFVNINYKIEELYNEGMFIVSMTASVCLESNGPCELEIQVLDNVKLPKPLCNFNQGFAIPDFSLASWLDKNKVDIKLQLQSYARDLLMEELGIAGYLQSPQCQFSDYQLNTDRWDIGMCGADLSLPTLPKNLACRLPDYCTGIQCCVYIPVLDMYVEAHLLLDICDLRLSIGLENMVINESLAHYNYNTEKIVSLGNMVRLNYKIEDLEAEEKILFSLKLEICFETKGDCLYSYDVFKDTKISKQLCDLNSGFPIPNFNLNGWLTKQGFPSNVTQLSELMTSKLLEHLSIAEYLQQPGCDLTSSPLYSTADSHGWNTECDGMIMLPDLPGGMICHLDSTCTSVTCCTPVALINRNINSYLTIDPCNSVFKLGIENYQFEFSLFKTDFNVQKQFNVERVININYKITDIPGEDVYYLDLGIQVCFNNRGPCTIEATIFSNTKLPKLQCSWQKGLSKSV
ncbi:uncharacterized protein LOC127727822 [Mytilus californianus]|uniref:uncharacterized protein LOC127727822 n=1 Tax=Mytilus californianus TaxID=6549 RepID=UPI00224706BD|nr:uncharacterized protein LOC127727822 [Mytilus californianus]